MERCNGGVFSRGFCIVLDSFLVVGFIMVLFGLVFNYKGVFVVN